MPSRDEALLSDSKSGDSNIKDYPPTSLQRVSLTPNIPQASSTGPVNGQFTLSRSSGTGAVDIDLETNGFASPPNAGDVLAVSTMTDLGIKTFEVDLQSLSLESFAGTLSLRFYFFDNADIVSNINRIDDITLNGTPRDLTTLSFHYQATEIDFAAAASSHVLTSNLTGTNVLATRTFNSTSGGTKDFSANEVIPLGGIAALQGISGGATFTFSDNSSGTGRSHGISDFVLEGSPTGL